MSDSYQAVYDAVRSRISNGDIGYAVSQAVRDTNLSHYAEMIMRTAQEAAGSYGVPSAIYRPVLSADGDQWCALYGDNLQSGISGFGDTPAKAMAEFDANWYRTLTPAAALKATGAA